MTLFRFKGIDFRFIPKGNSLEVKQNGIWEHVCKCASLAQALDFVTGGEF